MNAPIDSETMGKFNLPNGMVFALTAADYVRDWSLPQFHFPLMAACMGYMMRHLKQAPAA